MEPALAQFESKYSKKINLVTLDVDEKDTPEFRKYGAGTDKMELPFTVWLDASGKKLSSKAGNLTAAQLTSLTNQVLAKYKKH